MTQPLILGLTGKRKVGKSTICNYLIARHGFTYLHAFAGGKAAARAFFMHHGVDAETAHRMTDGDLKDVPSPRLPGGATPRFFLEKFGAFMVKTLGPEWTFGLELDLTQNRAGATRILADSIVLEEGLLREAGGLLVMITRAQASAAGIQAPETNAMIEKLTPDLVFANDFDSVTDLFPALDQLVEEVTRSRAA